MVTNPPSKPTNLELLEPTSSSTNLSWIPTDDEAVTALLRIQW
jgi:hypothetical protein